MKKLIALGVLVTTVAFAVTAVAFEGRDSLPTQELLEWSTQVAKPAGQVASYEVDSFEGRDSVPTRELLEWSMQVAKPASQVASYEVYPFAIR